MEQEEFDLDKYFLELILPDNEILNLENVLKKFAAKNFPDKSICEVIDLLIESEEGYYAKIMVLISKKIKDLICKK
jgi:hypothetical protein